LREAELRAGEHTAGQQGAWDCFFVPYRRIQGMMKKICVSFVMILVSLLFQAGAFAASPLTLLQTLQMPGDVKGNFDHLAIDVQGHRLFTTPEYYKSVVVFDYQTGKIVHVIGGIGMPHAVLYREDRDRIFVTDGEPGAVKVFDGKSYELLKTIKLLAHTDSITYDLSSKLLYVITGGKLAQQEVSRIAVIDTTTENEVGEIQIEGDELEAMTLEEKSAKIYVNNTAKNRVDVIDIQKKKLITSWPITMGQSNTSLTLDEANHRLFVGCRSGKLVVFDTTTGKEVESLPMTKGVDDMIFEPQSKRIYASCGDGSGFVEVYQEDDANHLRAVAQIPSGPMGKTSLLSAALHRYFVSVPQHGNTNAAVLIYDVN
jgi:DNA-binding beta-propeller fold protein YncE